MSSAEFVTHADGYQSAETEDGVVCRDPRRKGSDVIRVKALGRGKELSCGIVKLSANAGSSSGFPTSYYLLAAQARHLARLLQKAADEVPLDFVAEGMSRAGRRWNSAAEYYSELINADRVAARKTEAGDV